MREIQALISSPFISECCRANEPPPQPELVSSPEYLCTRLSQGLSHSRTERAQHSVWTTVNTQSFPSFIHSSNIEYALHFKWYSRSQEDSGNRTEDPCHPVREERQQTLWHLVKVLYEQTKQKGVGEDWSWRRGFSILNGVENSICQMPPIFKHISISETLKYFKAHFTTMKRSSKKIQ